MTLARKRQVDPDVTPFYHVRSLCVRQGFLLGRSKRARRNYAHRRDWIVARLHEVCESFSISVCAYAIMSNHYHLVVHIDATAPQTWPEEEVARRWGRLYSVDVLVRRYLEGETETEAEADQARAIIDRWRRRLADLGWFMKSVNEPIARRANAEDGLSGKFFDGRYRSQALLDEQAVLACMCYVDLNPVRADMARRPEESEFTSIYQRILELRGQTPGYADDGKAVEPPPLAAFEDPASPLCGQGSFENYLALVDWTGRAVRTDKRGAIPADIPPLLERLGVEPKDWIRDVQGTEKRFRRAIGAVEKLREYAARLNQHWVHGQGGARPPGWRPA